MRGEFFWYDVMTTDTRAAADFYAKVVGWGVQDASTPGAPYTLFTIDGQGVAGLMPIPDHLDGQARPVWMAYIEVDDVDQTAAAIEAEGGAVHRAATEVEGVIRFAVVADPQGAVFLIAKGLSDRPMRAFPDRTPGTAGWRELYTTDWRAALAFYEKLFGWTAGEAFDMGPMGTYQLFATGGDPVGGMMNKPEQIPAPFWGIYFNVDSIEAAAERVRAGGGSVLMGPHQVPGDDWIVQCTDPQGAMFSLTSRQK